MNRHVVDRPGQELWSSAWTVPDVARQQHEGAVKALHKWLGGDPHAAFDPFVDLLNRCEVVGGETLLEVGCGAGYYQPVVHHVRPQTAFLGIDVSEEMVRIAKQNYDGSFLVGVAENLPFSDYSQSIVVLGSVIGHCDDWKKAIEEAFRVSKRWVILHRVATTRSPHVKDTITNTVKTAYGVQMAERILWEPLLLEHLRQYGKQVGDALEWSVTEEGFQASYLFEKYESC